MAPIPFVKMHGCGNDYVVVAEGVPFGDPAAFARSACERRLGVGADGLLVVGSGSGGDVTMRMFNPDGSEAGMCGNGLRCAALFARAEGLAGGRAFGLRTTAGRIPVEILTTDPFVARVDLGPPRLERAAVPMTGPPGRVVDELLEVDGRRVHATALSMGNPHAVVFVDDVASVPVAELGPAIERLPVFPERTNVSFVEVASRARLVQRTWERGAKETPACGSGACAAAVAAALTGRADREVEIRVPGGTLRVVWRASDDHVLLEGPAVEVFRGRLGPGSDCWGA